MSIGVDLHREGELVELPRLYGIASSVDLNGVASIAEHVQDCALLVRLQWRASFPSLVCSWWQPSPVVFTIFRPSAKATC